MDVNVLDFLMLAMKTVNVDDFIWDYNQQTGFSTKLDPFNPIVIIDSKYYRPLEVDELQADITAAKTHLGWNPEYSFNELVKEMVIEDVKILSTRT